ncbi:MAG TPA: MaoC family dehydratase [Polyangia bacterium]|nr:MaoC family dehydratase [Polyangia bacterium]
MRERYFEDFAVGQTFLAGPTAPLTAEQIKAFAGQFDPQPFHLDEEAAKRSIFKGLAASGWHTASLTMRLFVESDVQPVGGYVGMGGEQLRWPRPTRPGDTLRVEIQVTETRPSKSRPDAGIVKLQITTFNQNDEVVQIARPVMMVPKRPA